MALYCPMIKTYIILNLLNLPLIIILFPKQKQYFFENKYDLGRLSITMKLWIDYLVGEKVFDEKNNSYKHLKDTAVIIMAGGKGNRLKPFTNILPKPLVPINDSSPLKLSFSILSIINVTIFI